MRNPIYVLKSLEEKTKLENYKFQRLYRNLYNPEFYLIAYKNIASKQGSMTTGTDGETLTGMSTKRIDNIIVSLRDHSYQPNPARRTYITKKNSAKQRPLGIPSTDDKLVQEVVRMLLEAIFEPKFSKHSHGFRPHRSCHTALKEVQNTFTGAKWIIEGDIKACFDCFDHQVLIALLRRHIEDEYFISLMWKFLKAGYMEQWDYHQTWSGTPQGSGMSPILANIYLSELDTFMEEFKNSFDKGNSKCRHLNPAYSKLHSRYMYHSKKLTENKDNMSEEECENTKKLLRNIQKEKLNTPYYPAIQPNFKRIQYNRYADDFLIGVIGSKEDALNIKAEIKEFLEQKLKLILSEEKTKVTHSSDLIRYLGYDVTVCRDKSTKRNANGTSFRAYYGSVKMYLPKEKWIGKLQELGILKIKKDNNGHEYWKTLHRGKLMNRPEVEIISQYNSEIRGMYNYYRLASNVSGLGRFHWLMETSMMKTFAAKYNSSINKVKIGRMKNGIFGVNYEIKSGTKRCEFYSEQFIKKDIPAPAFTDILPNYQKYAKPNSLAKRLLDNHCELCASQSDDVKAFHSKTLKDLKGELVSEQLMLQKRRKSLVLCANCFEMVSKKLL